MRLTAFCKHFFGDDEALSIRKDCNHALFSQIPHGHEQISEERLSISPETSAEQFLAHTIVNELADADKGLDPVLPDKAYLSQFGFRRLGDPSNRTEPV